MLSTMRVFLKLLESYSRIHQIRPLQVGYATLIEKELEVPTFCDIHIDVPYNIQVKPLDVHKYHNCDKLIIKLDERCEQSLEYDVNGNQITLSDSATKTSNIFCIIKAPIKANLYVKAEKDITVGYFHGDNLHLTSHKGNIFVDKFQGNSVKLSTNTGNITLHDLVQAANITANVLENGSISTGRLQGLNLKLLTNKGNISVESSYSHESCFEIVDGNLDLHNAHKSCTIFMKNGQLNLTGFDGKLVAILEKGSADIHLSRITDNSEINILNGTLNLKITDTCQDYVQFKIKSKNCDIFDNIKSTINSQDNDIILTPDIYIDNTVSINCLNGLVNIQNFSWQDMIRHKLNK